MECSTSGANDENPCFRLGKDFHAALANGILPCLIFVHILRSICCDPSPKLLQSSRGSGVGVLTQGEQVMVSFSRNAAAPLNKFHRDVESRAYKIGTIAGLSMLQHQVATYETILVSLHDVFFVFLNR